MIKQNQVVFWWKSCEIKKKDILYFFVRSGETAGVKTIWNFFLNFVAFSENLSFKEISMLASKNIWTHCGCFQNKKTGEHFGDYGNPGNFGNPGIFQRPTLFQPKSQKATTPIFNIFQFLQPLNLVAINGNPGNPGRPRSNSKSSQPDSSSSNQGMCITGCWGWS